MKKKYWIILFFLISIGLLGGKYFYQSPIEKINTTKIESNKSPEEILQDDYHLIVRNLKSENIENLEWEKINDYRLSETSIVKVDNAKRYFQVAQSNLPDLYSCLKKDFCGMHTRGEEDPYFDTQRTPAHILINRNLKIIKEALKQDLSLKSEVNWELLLEIAHSDEEFLQVEALDIIRQFDPSALKTEELLKMTDAYKGEAKAKALLKIAQKESRLDKKLIANEIEEVFAMSDANTVISVLEKLKSMNLLSVDIERLFINLCRFKESHNWLMIKYEAKKINSNFESECE